MNPIEAATAAILAKVPVGYGMTRSEAVEYAIAAIAAYLRAESARRESTEGGGWCAVLAAEIESQGD